MKNKTSLSKDSICNKIIKILQTQIVDALVIMINKSMSEGYFPRAFKRAIVKPLCKAKDKSEIDNYRSISLLRVASKIFERVVNDRLMTFLENNKMLYEGQYGFRQGRSTIDPVTDVTGNILSRLEKKTNCYSNID